MAELPPELTELHSTLEPPNDHLRLLAAKASDARENRSTERLLSDIAEKGEQAKGSIEQRGILDDGLEQRAIEATPPDSRSNTKEVHEKAKGFIDQATEEAQNDQANRRELHRDRRHHGLLEHGLASDADRGLFQEAYQRYLQENIDPKLLERAQKLQKVGLRAELYPRGSALSKDEVDVRLEQELKLAGPPPPETILQAAEEVVYRQRHTAQARQAKDLAHRYDQSEVRYDYPSVATPSSVDAQTKPLPRTDSSDSTEPEVLNPSEVLPPDQPAVDDADKEPADPDKAGNLGKPKPVQPAEPRSFNQNEVSGSRERAAANQSQDEGELAPGEALNRFLERLGKFTRRLLGGKPYQSGKGHVRLKNGSADPRRSR